MNAADSDVRVVLCTCPPECAADLARKIVGERWAACVNIIGGVRSVYRWEGEIQDDAESLLVIKVAAAGVERLQSNLVAEHPYDVPEVLVIGAESGSDAYLSWVAENTAPPQV